jgi:hypothetical protein
MFLILAAYLGGVLTILSPCILPVLPFVFARSDQPFTRSGLPILRRVQHGAFIEFPRSCHPTTCLPRIRHLAILTRGSAF